MPTYGAIDHEYGMTLATTDPADDGPVWMVNLMKYKERAEYPDGTDGGRSGREADDEYTPTASLQGVGARLVYVADVEATLLGDGTEWDRVAIVRYPTRRAFVEMQQRDDFRESHVHKQAGMAFTIVAGGIPMEIDTSALDAASRSWDEVAHPPTAADGPLHILHLIRWSDGGREAMEGYHEAAFTAAAAHGGRIVRWFGIEGTILGDGRTWDQARINEFPSLRAFTEVVADPRRAEGQADPPRARHRRHLHPAVSTGVGPAPRRVSAVARRPQGRAM